MTNAERSRQPNRASSIYKGTDDFWHGRVTVGVKDDGRPDRRHVMRRSRADTVKASAPSNDSGTLGLCVRLAGCGQSGSG